MDFLSYICSYLIGSNLMKIPLLVPPLKTSYISGILDWYAVYMSYQCGRSGYKKLLWCQKLFDLYATVQVQITRNLQ